MQKKLPSSGGFFRTTLNSCKPVRTNWDQWVQRYFWKKIQNHLHWEMDGLFLEKYISMVRFVKCHFQITSQCYQIVAPAQSLLVASLFFWLWSISLYHIFFRLWYNLFRTLSLYIGVGDYRHPGVVRPMPFPIHLLDLLKSSFEWRLMIVIQL